MIDCRGVQLESRPTDTLGWSIKPIFPVRMCGNRVGFGGRDVVRDQRVARG
jgi:hypothetical protein